MLQRLPSDEKSRWDFSESWLCRRQSLRDCQGLCKLRVLSNPKVCNNPTTAWRRSPSPEKNPQDSSPGRHAETERIPVLNVSSKCAPPLWHTRHSFRENAKRFLYYNMKTRRERKNALVRQHRELFHSDSIFVEKTVRFSLLYHKASTDRKNTGFERQF